MTHSKLQIAHLLKAIGSDEDFETLASKSFEHQYKRNKSFKTYIDLIGKSTASAAGSPAFLPVELFKTHDVRCNELNDLLFLSSGTSAASERAKHFVHDKFLYKDLATAHFEEKYGPLEDWVILALLPSYIENGESSLVLMADGFIKTAHKNSKFLLHKPEALLEEFNHLRKSNQKTLLIGVSYALLDFCEKHPISFPELVVMETGGMKGRRKELTRSELHDALKLGFPSSEIHSEYGMTELLSQAYSSDGKWFSPPRWMKVFTTEVSDPFKILGPNQRGLLAFIDLANYHSCSFIQTRDIGVVNDQGIFTVEGRLDKSDLRGCNLLYT